MAMANDRVHPRKRKKVCSFCVDKVTHIDSADRRHQARPSDRPAALRSRLSFSSRSLSAADRLFGFAEVFMFSITLICMGKLKERFYTEAAAEYAKRLRAYCDFQLIELPECRLPEDPNDTQIAQGLQKEAELIRAKLPKGCFFCVLTPEGKLLSSEQLADTLRQAKSGGRSFLIGSSFGIAPELKKLADLQLSMSKMTFPHHLARVMALEQLYRAEAIQAGSKYHK